jgi:hypothetical protein
MIKKYVITIACTMLLGYAQSIWLETTQSDFSDGYYERNIYASNRGGGVVEFAPRFDLNNDGYVDLYTADRLGTLVRIYWGSAVGYSASNVTLFPSSGGANCDAADLNGDGFPEFLVSHYFEKLSVYWGGTSGPNPLDHQDFPMLAWNRQGVFAADFNKDGYLDIATTQEFTPGNGSIIWGSAAGYNINNRTDLPVYFGIHNIEVADINKDTWLDVLYVEYYGYGLSPVRIYWGSSTGFQPSNSTAVMGPAGNTGVSIADLDADGWLDIVATGWYDSQSYIYWGSETGYSSSNMQILNSGYCYGGTAVADIDKDTYLDIIYHRGGYGTVPQRIYWGSASGYSNSNFTDFGLPLETTGGLIADLNDDGNLDVFTNTRTPGTESYIFFGPSFTTYISLPVEQDHHAMFREIGNVYNRHYDESYISSVFDAGQVADWGTVTWDDSIPSGTSMSFSVRTGNTPLYDSTWSNWCQMINGGAVPDSLNSRYMQYMAVFSYMNPAYLPCLYEACIAYTAEGITVSTPNGDESWIRGAAYDITWSSIGVSGNVKIELYKGGSFNSIITSSTANDGSYTWNIPSGQLPGIDYRIRIVSLDDPTFFDFSDSDFSICSQIALITPNGGEVWYVNESYDVTWAPSGIGGNVILQYSTDGGSNWLAIVDSTLDDGNYSWTLPNTPTTHARAKITHLICTENSDSSDADFIITQDSIMVVSPNGGECLLRGDSCEITWFGSGIGDFADIELYKSSSYYSTIADSVPNSGAYVWYIPSGQVPADDYQVRISSVANPLLFDLSDSCFTIFSQIVVTAPNGGEIWYVGESHDITWAPGGIGGDVFVEYSTNSGSSWLVITSATPDNGSYAWTIPNTTTTHGRAKITNLTCANNIDESDADFTITYSAVEEQDNKLGLPSVFCLDQNQPNPFSKLTLIEYGIPRPCRVHIGVYDVLGKKLATLLDDALTPGYYQAVIDIDDLAGSALPNGVYFYRMVADDYLETRMMTVLR